MTHALYRMAKLRFVLLIFYIFWAFCFIAIFGDVFLDNSQDNCVGIINENASLEQNWTEYVNITNSYSCLKTCLQKHERAKTTAYDPGHGCFCNSLSYDKLHLDLIYTGCPPDGSGNVSKPQLKVYNMSKFTVQLRFKKYFKRHSRFNNEVDLEALLYQNGTSTNDSKILKDVFSSGIGCEVITRKGQRLSKTRISCLGDFRFTLLGETQICLRTDKTSGICENITVLEQINISDIKLSHERQGMLLSSTIQGTVFNLSFYLDDKLVETVDIFAQYEEVVFKYCEIDWKLRSRAVMFALERKLVVNATNPLSPSAVSKERTFKLNLGRVKFKLSYVYHTMSDGIQTTVEAEGGVTEYDGLKLKYKWSLDDSCINDNVSLLASVTSVRYVKAISQCDVHSQCRINLVAVGEDGSNYIDNIRSQYLFYNLHPDICKVYEIVVPTDYFLRGKEATFEIKKTNWSGGPPYYIWKLNGKEMSRKPIFTHTFNATGSYTVSVFDKSKELASKNVSILERLTKLEIVVTSFRYFGKPVSMRAIVNCNVSVTYNWDFGDGKQQNTSSNVVKHRYYKPGVYTVRVVANNSVSEIEASKTVNEIEFCPVGEFETSFEDGKEVKQNRSLPIHLEVSTRKLVCFEPVTIVFKWTIFKWIDEVTKWRDWEKQNSDKSTDSIYIPPNVLDYGKYRFNVTVNVSGFGVSHSEKFSSVINVIERPVVAIIRGGFIRYVKENSTFFLDATPSFDPDNLNANLRFLWSIPRAGMTTESLTAAVIEVNTTHLKESAEFKVTVWSGKRKNVATQRVTVVNSKEIKTNMILDCPLCDMGHDLNPSNLTRIMEKCSSRYCPSNDQKASWELYELRENYGKPKLEKIHCTVSDQTSLPQSNKSTSQFMITYDFRKCEHAKASQTTESVCGKLTNQLKSHCEKSYKEVQLVFKTKEPYSELLDIRKNFFPGNRIFIIKRIVNVTVVAERSFRVQDKPRDYSCEIKPAKGVELLEDFEINCNMNKNAGLVYKVLYKRVNADSSTISNIFFQRNVPRFKFHLPSGDEDKNSLIISIESDKGVVREYCGIDMIVARLVSGSNTTSNVEKYLYNRSLAVNESFSEHRYAPHGQTLYNITLISDVLNRKPNISNSAKLLYLRTQIREMLIDILSRVTVSSEYVSRQFASSLESCTRVPEELTNSSAVAVVEILYKLMRRKRHGNEQSLELANDFQENILKVASRIKTKMSSKEHALKLLESLNNLFEDTLRTKFVRTPLEIININKNVFNARLMKFSPYRSENVRFMCGETRVMLNTRGDEVSKKIYDCDLFGCGFQAVTMEINPFRDDDTYQKVSSLTKLKIHNCKKMRNCGEKITGVKMLFPIRFDNSTLQHAIYLSARASHLFTLKRDIENVLYIELVPVGSLSKKLRLRIGIRCADAKYRYHSEFSFSTHMERLQKFFSPKNFSEKCKDLNVTVDIKWEVEPSRYESLRTEVMYNLNVRSLGCLSKKRNGKWSEDSCKCEIYNSPVRSLDCSCPKLQGSDYSYIVVAKNLLNPSTLKIVVESERNGIINMVLLVISLCYAVAVLVLFIKERQHYKNSNAIPLERCDPSHTHKYKITVYTGHCCGAETTAKVAVVLYGENNSSYPVELFTKNRDLFQRNSRDVFVVSVRENLGSLNCIHLWHDNSGSSPSWFVDKLVIKDLSTNKKWMFRCSRWLAVDKNDGMLDCKIKPFDFKRNFTFKEFQLALGEKLMDFHIWLSLIRMPTYSLFTRAERLTCCISLLFAYLFFNAYFCHNYTEFVIMDCVSVFNPTFSQFKVGVFTTLSCLPIYLLFSVMFRYTKSFIWLQPAKNAKVAPYTTDSKIKPNIHEPSAVENCNMIVSEIDRSSEDTRRRKQLELAALLVKEFEDQENLCSDEDSTTETTGITRTKVSHDPPVNISQNRPNTEHELSSDSSDSSLHFPRPTLFRFPTCFNVSMWIGCIMTLLLSSLHTVQYVSRFDDVTVRCYKQSVFWSLFISMFISQPFQALFITVIQAMRRHFMFHSSIIDELGQEIEDDVVLDDSMFASFTEKNFEDPLYRKLFCLKYLQPLSRKAVTRARCKVQKRKITVMFLRDVLMYCLLLVFLYSLNPFWNQKLIFFHNNGLKTFFNRQVNTSSLLTWWSSSSQKFLDTLTFDEETLTMRAFHNNDLVVGNPEVTMMFKYCQDNNSYQINGSLANKPKRHCTRKVEEKAIGLNESQKKNWLGLAHSINEKFNEYVTDISLKFVIYSPPLAVFSVIKLSSHTIVPSTNVQSDVSVTTAGFHVDRSSTLSFQTICQLLFTLVPVLLLIHQVFSSTKNKKRQTGLGVNIEFLIVFLSFYSVILMWIWIKYQYFTLGVMLRHQFEANIVNDIQTIYKYQEVFKYSIAFMLFFVLIKVCHVIGLDTLLDCHIETFTSVIISVLFPLFALLVVFVGFAHMGVLLFGDHLKMFGTFLQAFSLNVVYLRRSGTDNFIVDTPYQQMLLALYVIAFCVCMILFSNLVKAAFCQAQINVLLTVKNRRRMPIKVYFFRKIRRVFSLLWSYLQEPEDEDDTLKRVPMSYIFKELDEQLNDLEFRLTHLTCKANMPAKVVTHDGSSSDGSDVEYVYKVDNERPSYSSFHRDLSSSNSSHFEYPTQENMADSKVECSSRESSASGSMTTHAETAISNTSKRRRPFERSMRAFPTPINETLNSSEHPQVLLDPWVGEGDCAESGQTTPVYLKHHAVAGEEVSAIDCKVNEDTMIGERSVDASTYHVKVKDLYGRTEGNCSIKKDRGGPGRPQVIVNDFTNNACEADVEDFYGYLTPRRPKVRLDVFEDESSPIASDDEDCSPSKTESFPPSVGTSLEKQCQAESTPTAANNLDSTPDNEQLTSRQRPFQQPSFPFSINHLFSQSSEI